MYHSAPEHLPKRRPGGVPPDPIGGARMGSTPETSVIDAKQRAWAVPNLFICDGSVCPIEGAANSALTIMALASRLAERMISGEAMDDDPAQRAGTGPTRQPVG